MADSTRTLAARVAAYSRWAHEDPRPNAARASAAFRAKFLDEVDPDRKLPEEERQRRAESAFRAHMTRLALRSAKARRKRAQK
jgi:hypothetical protein